MRLATLYILLFAAVLAAPFAFRSVVRQTPSSPADAVRLIIITPNNQDICREFARAFDTWHRSHFGQPAILDFRVPGGAGDILRQLQMSYAAARNPTGAIDPSFTPDYDLVWGGGDFFFDRELKPLGLLQPLGISTDLLHQAFPEPTIAGGKLYDTSSPNPLWVGVVLSGFGIIYNPELFSSLNLPPPTTWSDLTSERLAGLLALADPTHSGSVAVAYAVILQRAMADEEENYFATHPDHSKTDPAYHAALSRGWSRGMSQLMRMAMNARYFTASATVVPADVSTGDAAAGISIDLYARAYEDSAGTNRVRFVLPRAATAITADPVAILSGVRGDRLLLARRFVEFLLSRQGQLLWAIKPGQPDGPRDRALRRLPIRRDVYDQHDRFSNPLTNPFEETGHFNQRTDWMGSFSDLRTLWRCAWIDSRSDLKAAYQTILTIPDATRRTALLNRLAESPVTMDELDSVSPARKQAKSKGEDIEQFDVSLQLRWANLFRAHDRSLRDEALK